MGFHQGDGEAPNRDGRNEIARVAREICEARGGASRYELIFRAVTLDGRVQQDLALLQLDRSERTAIDVLKERGTEAENPAFKGALGYTAFGKPYLDTPGQEPVANRVEVLPPIEIIRWSSEEVEHFLRANAEQDSLEATVARSYSRLLHRELAGDLAVYVAQIRTVLTKIAPIHTWWGQRAITNLYSPRSLSGQNHVRDNPKCILHDLESIRLRDWDSASIVFVDTAITLLEKFGSKGLEYLNGVQIPDAILLAERSPIPKQNGEFKGAVPYRQVCGALRNKRIALAKRQDLSDEFSRKLADILSNYGVASVDHLQNLCIENSSQFSCLLERLLALGLQISGSEIALSRGLRDLPRLADVVRGGDREQLLDSTMDDQYCCVVGSKENLPAEQDRRWAISSRMRYNGWHFRPWSTTNDKFYSDLEQYYPPDLPDLTTNADLVHAGHVSYAVRHAVRVPKTITVFEEEFFGLVDIRFSKSTGSPYTELDLLQFEKLANVVQVAYSKLLRQELEFSNIGYLDFYSLDWFRKTNG